MILKPFVYSCLNARIRARRERFAGSRKIREWFESDYSGIVRDLTLSKSVVEIGPELIAREWAKRRIDDCNRIIHVSPKRTRMPCKVMLFRRELNCLKTLIRIKKKDLPFDMAKIIISQELQEALTEFPGNLLSYGIIPQLPTFSVLIPNLNNYETVELERALDIDYYTLLGNQLKYFSGMEKKKVSQFIGFAVDTANILNIIRLRTVYGLSEKECSGYLFPAINLQKTQINRILECEDTSQILSKLARSEYSFLTECENISEMQGRIILEMERIISRYFRGVTLDAGLVFAYIWLSEIDEYYFRRMLEARFYKNSDLLREAAC